MTDANRGRFCKETSHSEVLSKINAAARKLTGGSLIVLLRHGDEVLEIFPSGFSTDLPDFCQIFRETRDGKQKCLTCRMLMIFAACHRDVIDYTCHGGVPIIAAASPSAFSNGERPVVASCTFADTDREKGWLELRDNARDIGVDLRKLHSAYNLLSSLTDDRRVLTRVLVDIAASVISEIMNRIVQGQESDLSGIRENKDSSTEGELEHFITSAFFLAHDGDPNHKQQSNGAHLIQSAMEMLIRNPNMPFSVANIARAANMTPNHFSTLFRAHAGETFSNFLTEQRIILAKNLLRDMTLNISEVATLSGFPDNSYFARRFKQKTGMSPIEWRNSL